MELSKGPIKGAQKIALYGVEGIGKTYFASRFPRPLFIDTEGSTRYLDVVRTTPPSTWDTLMSQVKETRDMHFNEFDTLVIDTIDWAERLCMSHLCNKHKKGGMEDWAYGKGYIYLAEEIGRLLTLLEEVAKKGVNVVLVAHAAMRKFEQPDEMGSYDRWELKLQKKVSPLIKEWADMVLFANYKTFVVINEDKKAKAQGGKRVIYTTHHPCWDAKNRHDLLDVIPLDFDEIKHCIPARTEIPIANPAPEPEPEPDTFTESKLPDEQLWDDLVKETRIDDTPAPRRPRKGKNDGLINELQKLMTLDAVTDDEVRRAVASRGYYEESMPMANYDKEFVQTVLIGAWDQVLGMIKENRETPF